MILRSVFGATVVVLAFSSVAVDPAYAQRRDGALLPQEQDGDVDRGRLPGSRHRSARWKG